MGTITTLRPSSTSSGSGWTPSVGTLHGVTSDNSDATYATWGGAGTPLILATPVDAPPVGERRHQVRLRARGEDGDAWWAVRLSSGVLVAGAAAQFTSSPGTVSGSWGFGAPADGSTVLYTYVEGQSTGVKIEELYLDVDSREAPTFTPQMLDGSGAVTTTISDTVQPTVRASSIDLDDLNARQYRYWVTLSGAVVWDTGVVSGASVNRQTAPLENGSYVAHFQIWSTLGSSTAYASDEETLAFTVAVGLVPSPDNPSVEVEEGTPFYRIEACAPYVGDLDGAVGYIEIQRVDCPVGGYLSLPGSSGGYASSPGPTVLDLPGGAGNYVTSPDDSTLDIVGDIDVRAWVAADDWTPAADSCLVSKYNVTGNQRSYFMSLLSVGKIRFTWSANGIAATNADSSVATGFTDGTAHWVRATLAVATGTVTFYTSPDLETPVWTQLGTTVVSGVTSIFVSTATANIGARSAGTSDPFAGLVHKIEIRSGIGGTIVADPSFDHSTQSVAAVEDSTGKVWTMTGTAAVVSVVTTDLQATITAGRDDDWFPATEETLAARYNTTGNQRSWRLMLGADGYPSLTWSANGTATTTAVATERPLVDASGVARLRVVLDVNDGAGGWTVTFFAHETDDDAWVQLGDVVSNSGGGTTSLFNSTAPLTVGAYLAGAATVAPFTGRVYSLEVRDGAAGIIAGSPDFTAHLDGTSEFDDAQSNTWTVHSPGSIYSPTSTVTVAMLGPLATGACAEWVDFTLPRTGVGATCDHDPVSCCSYYRARTVGREDGDLRISNWSDIFESGVPAGLIVMWPDTNASIPLGWNRVTALDSKYPKGIATAVTPPGATGGAATHVHATPGHTHDTSHIHTTTTPTSAASGISTANTAGALVSLSSHTHSRPSTNSATVVSGSASPASDTENNDPARLDVIWMESDGTPSGVPDGALGLTGDISLSGWADYANAANRFFKGAAAAGNGGATTASQLDAHVHAVAAHTHAGTSHSHTSGNTGTFSATLNPAAGPNSVTSAASHSHPITVNAASTQSLASGSGGNSSASGTLDPPYRNLRAKENVSGLPDLPVGIIGAWRGSLGTIPDFWQLCDGTGGTPDMSGLYPRGATASIGVAGGSAAAHTHTSPTHNHTTTGHAHTSATGTATGTANVSATATVSAATGVHTHSLVDTASTTPTVASITSGALSSTTTEAPYEEVAFIQLVAEPTPPDEPDLFCLTWDPDAHLIRTTGPDGPLWANVWGKFEWNVERPITASTGVMGTRFVTSAAPGGRNLSMTAAVESEAELAILHEVLSRPLVLISPSDASEVWAAPVSESVRIVKIGRIRQVTASFIGTGPQPPPQLADVGV
jgi:hypothetical protein